eukprot:1161937-Pelagomonas_calceolata.AAC.1
MFRPCAPHPPLIQTAEGSQVNMSHTPPSRTTLCLSNLTMQIAILTKGRGTLIQYLITRQLVQESAFQLTSLSIPFWLLSSTH